jgi:hypothetical protein
MSEREDRMVYRDADGNVLPSSSHDSPETAVEPVSTPASQSVADAGESFDPALQRELDRGEFAGGERTVEGTIKTIGEGKAENDIEVTVWVPLPVGDAPNTDGDDHFSETMTIPPPDAPLSASKFGRLLTEHGYSRSQARALIDEPVECSYTSEGWQLVDPATDEYASCDESSTVSLVPEWPDQQRADTESESTSAEGVILRTNEWDAGADIELIVHLASGMSDGDSQQFTESMPVPAPGKPRRKSKFGQLLAAHDYLPSEANQIVGETVHCVTIEGEWRIADPSSADTTQPDTDTATEASTVETDETGLSFHERRKWSRHRRKGGYNVGGGVVLLTIIALYSQIVPDLKIFQLFLVLSTLGALLCMLYGSGHLVFASLIGK